MTKREPLVFGEDWDLKPVAVPPTEAAFREVMPKESDDDA
jgi:hypothetical protein